MVVGIARAIPVKPLGAHSAVRYLEVLYRKMREAGASILELDLGPQEKILLKRRQAVSQSPQRAVLEKPLGSHRNAEVRAPLSGIFYRALSPSAPPFVAIEQRVAAGDILCIIEAMKVMNEIKAAVGGRLIEILGVNGKHVKKGDVIFVIDQEMVG